MGVFTRAITGTFKYASLCGAAASVFVPTYAGPSERAILAAQFLLCAAMFHEGGKVLTGLEEPPAPDIS